MSRTVRAIGPGASWLLLSGTTPPVESRPTVGLRPTTPFSELGQVMEPSVSVPTASGASPAANAAPDPDDDPPALRSSAHGLPVRPPTPDQPLADRGERMLAHSERFVAPRTTRPASRRAATIGASRTTGRPASAREPAVPGSPTASTLSFTRVGTPWSGPRTCPAARSASSRAACWRASGAIASTARRWTGPGPLTTAIRSSRAWVSSTDVVRPAARSAARSYADAAATAEVGACGSSAIPGVFRTPGGCAWRKRPGRLHEWAAGDPVGAEGVEPPASCL